MNHPPVAASELRATSSRARTLDQRDLAALRPARENAPRQRKPAVLREVTSGIVCFCGERFGESQALEFMLHLRGEVGADLEILERRRQRDRDLKQRHGADPEYRARQNASHRERYATDSEYRLRIVERQRRRRADPEYRSPPLTPEQRERKSERDRERGTAIRELHSRGDHSRCGTRRCERDTA